MKRLINNLPFVALFLLPLLFYHFVDISNWISSGDVHAILEFASSLLAITAGVMVLLHFFTTGRSFFLIISIGLVLIGAEEFVHAVFSFNRILVDLHATYKLAISSTWLSGQFILVISFYTALVFGNGQIIAAKRNRYAVVFNIIGGIFAVFVTLIIFNLPFLPDFVQIGSITKKLIELSLALLFFIALILYFRIYVKQGSNNPVLWSIIAFIIMRILVHVFVFDSRSFYDAHWDIAHLLVLLSYFFPIFGVWGQTIKLHNYSRLKVTELRKEMAVRRQAEQDLENERLRLSLILQGTNAGTWEWNIQTGETIYNERWAEFFGYTIKELSPVNIDTWKRYSHPEDVKASDELLKKHFNGELDFYECEIRMKHKKGDWIWILDRGKVHKWDEKGKPLLISGTHQNITGRKLIEEALYESEEKYSRAFLTSPYAITITSAENGKFTEVNDAFISVSGFSREEVNDNSAVGLNMWVDKEEQKWVTSTLLVGGDVAGKEFLFRRKNGEIITALFYAKIIRIKNKPHILSIINDITIRKQAESELIKAKEKAEESDRLKTAFLANMSHEIRTPMNGILGFAELLKEPNLSDEMQQDFIKIIEKSGARMLNTINSIVDISKIESGQMEVDISESNINEQLEYIYSFFKPEVESKGLKFSFRNALSDKAAKIITDREKLFAVLTNLVKNAIKFCDKGSIEFGYEKKEGYIEFYVKDTGIGIPKDRQEAIFERFIQSDISDKRAYQGSGLGLTITRYYVEMLGGNIRVESEEGKGTIFYFTIPYLIKPGKNSASNCAPAVKDKKDKIRKLKILVAEDDVVSDLFLTKVLQKMNYKVLHAKTGVEAVEACRIDPYIDLVFMDIRMPVMDGYEATRQIRQFNKDIVIIAQTAYAFPGDREKAIKAGCNDYATKPVNYLLLHELIKKHSTIQAAGLKKLKKKS